MFSTQVKDSEWNRVWEKRGKDYHDASVQYPYVHEQELRLFEKNFDIKRGDTVLEVSAAGGYMLRRFRAALGDSLTLLAIEPSDDFAQFLPEYVQRVPNSGITDFALSDNSVHSVMNQAGLHHTEQQQLFFNEARRVLRKDGVCGACDVRKGSGPDAWLNGFVHEHNSQGHEGRFFETGAMTQMLQTAGFKNIVERPVSYTWDFKSLDEMATFCRMLFGLDRATPDQILKGVSKILGYSEDKDGQVHMNWELIHAVGRKS
jgi:ubiquinone/menaquinone biosynthesis C-methylase UbiE